MNSRSATAPTLFNWHFDAELESTFQHQYYQRVRPLLRVIALLLGMMFAAYAVRDFLDTGSWALSLQQDGVPALFFLLIAAATWASGFERFWQPAIFVGAVSIAAISLHKMASFLATIPELASDIGPFQAAALFFGQQIRTLMVCLALLRLQFKWMLALQLCVLGIGIWTFGVDLMTITPSTNEVARFLQPTLAITTAVLLAAFVEEQLARRAFLSAHELEIERNDERRKREHTEKTLQVLSQAIGVIVHDLGNPLTSVQMGASTLDSFIDADADKATLKEFTEIISSGAQMLNYLRLSLIEQTRVLEGRPMQVELKPVELLPLIEAGKRFQKPYMLGNRDVSIDGDSIKICADEMKMITVFMNLIGNALKYSDGEVRVTWRTHQPPDGDPQLLVAVCDCGTHGVGITQNQAGQLFRAFGRLETHAKIEGTGLGLLSVQKIIEAHGGETFIEGFSSGTPDSGPFSTAQNSYPTLLNKPHCTAFVMTCPLANEK